MKMLTDTIREAIRAAKANGWTQRRIAKAINVSEGNVSDFCRGACGIASPTLDKVAALLGLRLVVDVAVQRKTAARFRKQETD
jgi:transcriptional regulator with XRE-family HTH domain